MTKRKAENEVDSRVRNRDKVDNGSLSTKIYRWADLLLAATEELHVSDIPPWAHSR